MVNLPNASIEKPRRRWFQFSLRTLLLLMVLGGLGAAWYRKLDTRIKKQRAAVAKLKELKCGAMYDYELVNPKHFVNTQYLTFNSSGDSAIMRRLFGENASAMVKIVDIRPWAMTNDDLGILADLPELGCLYLQGNKNNQHSDMWKIVRAAPNLERLHHNCLDVTLDDYKAISQLAKLKYLNIPYGANCDDEAAECISRLANLRHIRIENSRITVRGIIALQKLRNLEGRVLDCPLVGLDRLFFKSTPKLKMFLFCSAKLNDEGMANLARSVPQIVHLDISDSKITDAAIGSLLQLHELEVLEVIRNDLSENGLKRLADLKNLKQLVIGPNEPTAELRRYFQARLPNCKIAVHSN